MCEVFGTVKEGAGKTKEIYLTHVNTIFGFGQQMLRYKCTEL